MTTIAPPSPLVERSRTIRDAHVARCEDCGLVIQPSLFWRLAVTVYLHQSGQDHRRVTYWQFKE